jgi:hypothetical protein
MAFLTARKRRRTAFPGHRGRPGKAVLRSLVCRKRRHPCRRAGAATVDYVLILAFIMPLVLISIVLSREILRLAYEFLCVLVSWPFM